MKMVNDKGEAVYYNPVEKHGRLEFVIKGIGDTIVVGRDRQKCKSRTFRQQAQADRYLARHGFKNA